MTDIVKEVVGTSFALTVVLADGQQITFQSGFAEDEKDEKVNARIDRLIRLSARQRAIAEVPNLKSDREQLVDQQIQTKMDEVKLDADYLSSLEDIDKQIAELDARQQDAFEKAYDSHATSGKRGAYEPSGATKQTIQGCLRDIESLKVAKKKAGAEREVVLQGREHFHRKIEARLAIIDAKIAEAESMGVA